MEAVKIPPKHRILLLAGATHVTPLLVWEDAYARREPAGQLRDDFRDAFMAGVDLATREPAAAARSVPAGEDEECE